MKPKVKPLKSQDFQLVVKVLIEIEKHPTVKCTIPLNAITLRIPLS